MKHVIYFLETQNTKYQFISVRDLHKQQIKLYCDAENAITVKGY